MNDTLLFLMTYGYALVFFCVLAEQLGVPLPSTPVLLAAGALGGPGQLNLTVVLGLAVAASLLGDGLWFYLGRTRGMSVLKVLCKISLEPDSCVRNTKAAYSSHGATWLLFAKFVPGLSTVAPPMAGMFRVSPAKFAALDAAGAGLWAGVFLLTGWWFRDQLEVVTASLAQVGAWLGIAVAVAFLLILVYKFIERRRIRRLLHMARITPVELKARMEAGERFTIVDLRNDFEWQMQRIPGSLIFEGNDLNSLMPAMPESEIVLYCSCPDEISSAAAAAAFKRLGALRIRPLEGGFPLWTALGFPVEAS